QSVVLVSDDSEGISVGMPVTFAGFAIGRVQRIELGDDAKVRIRVTVSQRDAHWLRVSSVFTIEKALVGGTRIRAFTGVLSDPPLPDGAVRPVLRGDATDELPKLVSTMKALLENLQSMTSADSNLQASLGHVNTVTGRMAGRSGVLGAVLGGDENARKVFGALDRANKLLDSLGGVSARLDQTLAKTDERVFGKDGVMDETQQSIRQLNAVLGDVRESLPLCAAVQPVRHDRHQGERVVQACIHIEAARSGGDVCSVAKNQYRSGVGQVAARDPSPQPVAVDGGDSEIVDGEGCGSVQRLA
ncbi:MAG: MCE family protein, partial [Mycobacteriaceae bacterium]|nr:MCE family protein [Mycobacteriaceae bacterium]